MLRNNLQHAVSRYPGGLRVVVPRSLVDGRHEIGDALGSDVDGRRWRSAHVVGGLPLRASPQSKTG